MEESMIRKHVEAVWAVLLNLPNTVKCQNGVEVNIESCRIYLADARERIKSVEEAMGKAL